MFVGVGTGLFFDRETARGAGRLRRLATARQTCSRRPTAASKRLAAQIEIALPDRSAEDKAFLSELELAGERPRIRELMAVDALTPHVREVNLR